MREALVLLWWRAERLGETLILRRRRTLSSRWKPIMLFGRRTKCSWKSLALLRWWSLLRRIICCHSSFSILFLSSLPLFFLDLFPPLPVEHLIPVLHFLSHPILLFLKLPLFLLLFVFLLLVSLPISLKIPYNTLFLLLLLHSLLLFDHIFMLSVGR